MSYTLILYGTTNWAGGYLDLTHYETIAPLVHTTSGTSVTSLGIDAQCGVSYFTDSLYGDGNAAIPTWELYQQSSTVGMYWALKSFQIIFNICDVLSCLQCEDSCYHCLTNSICIACDPNAVLLNAGTTSASCQCNNGFYMVGHVCYICDGSCLTCNGATSSNCLSCPNGRYLSGSTCPLCDPVCATCNAGTNNDCLTCITNYILTQIVAPAGNCAPICDISCATCSGLTASDCLTCPIHYQISPVVAPSGICVLICDFSCLTCSGYLANQCLSCNSNKNHYNGYCCDPSCLTCAGPLSSNCINCAAGYFSWQNVCVSSCPLLMVGDLTLQECVSCGPNCDICSTTSCLACSTGFYLNGGICAACFKTCKTCSKPNNNDCLSCFQYAALTSQQTCDV